MAIRHPRMILTLISKAAFRATEYHIPELVSQAHISESPHRGL